jgi:dephospho-CoA kinase
VIETFGKDLVGEDGTIQRQMLGARVFGAPENMAKLTAIVWPEIAKLAQMEIKCIKEDCEKVGRDGVIVLEAAVLAEARWFNLIDTCWVCEIDEAVAISRLTARNGLSEEDARRRISSQMTNGERRDVCQPSFHVNTDRPVEETASLVEAAWKSFLLEHALKL